MSRINFLLICVILSFPIYQQGVIRDFLKDATSKIRSKIMKDSNADSESIIQYVQKCGYNIFNHTVSTADGYFLDIFSIFKGNLSVNVTRKENPVLFFHGLYCTSNTWLTNGCKKSLPFSLADEGYTIWLGNNRGNAYGMKHDKYDNTSEEFWNFSWYDMAMFDVPKIVTYVFEQSNHQKIYYIGHSQGTLILTAWASQPENNATAYIKGFLALSPVYRIISSFSGPALVTSFTQLYNLFSVTNNGYLRKIATQFCVTLCRRYNLFDCKKILILGGINQDDAVEDSVVKFIRSFRDRTSAKNLIHYFQMMSTEETRAYDYGSVENMRTYGEETPTLVDARKLAIPTIVYSGGKDTTSTLNNVQAFVGILPNLVETFYYPTARFSHFIKGEGDKTKLESDIIRGLKLIDQCEVPK